MADVSEKDVNYAVRTPQNPKNQNFVQPIDVSKMNPSYPVIMIVHGWTDAGNASWIQNLTNAYFEHGDYNIISVNWQKPGDKNYAVSAKNTKEVGAKRPPGISINHAANIFQGNWLEMPS